MKISNKRINQCAINGWVALLLVCGISCNPDSSQIDASSILFKNVFVVDGTGANGFEADVLIKNDRIVRIGEIDVTASIVIEGEGRVLAPGFIDLHAHGNPLNNTDTSGGPYFANFIYQGVTTVCLGMDGFSDSDLLGWLQDLDSISSEINIVPFVGHSTLRLLSGIGYQEAPSEAGLRILDSLLQMSLNAGYKGLTTGLEYLPGGLAKTNELSMLAKTLGQHKSMMMSHIRNEDDDQVESSLNELLDMGEYCSVHISHIKVVYGKGPDRGKEVLALLGSARVRSMRVTADIYPYLASYTGIGILFPDWAKQPNDYEQVKQSRRAQLEQYLFNRVMLRNGPKATLLGTAPWTGLTLAEAADANKKPFVDFLIDDVGPAGASGAYFIMDETLQATLMTDSLIAFASDASPTTYHPRGYGTFAKVLETYVSEDHRFSLEEAIRKMTGLPAGILGFSDRGVIKEGALADLVLFNLSDVRDLATYENPHVMAIGFDYVVINGQVVKQGDNVYLSNAGRLLTGN